MDFDDGDKPKEVSKTRRFLPGRAGSSKPKSKPEPIAEKVVPPSQTDSPSESMSKSEHDVDATLAAPKVEPDVFNGSVKMEIDSKVSETTQPDFMDEDHLPPQEANQEEEEEEDVVVREIDVFFNPSLDAKSKIYVVQYPVRPSWNPYELDERCVEVRANPSTSEFEIDLSLDDNFNNYDHGSKLNITKQTLKTTWREPPTSDYAVGVLLGDKLHLNPVHAVTQLRPSLDYLSSKRKQSDVTEESVGTSRKQTKGVQASTDQKPIPEDNWVALKYHGLQSEFCSRYLKEMRASRSSSIDFNMSPEAYINSLCPRESSKNSERKLKRLLISLPLEERLKKLLCEGPSLFRYTVLKHYAPEFSDEEFLRVLQDYAWLVQGLWTPQNTLLGIEGLEAACRDYVLLLFSKDSTIKYSVIEATGRYRNNMKAMLNVFAKERPLLNDWKFKEPTDVSFIKSYPEIVKVQEILWKEKDETLTPRIIMEGGKSSADIRRNAASKNPPVTVKPEIPAKVSEKGGSSRNIIKPNVVIENMSEDVQKAILKALKKVFQTHKVCTYETICQSLRVLAVSTSNSRKANIDMAEQVAAAVDAQQEEVKQVISEVAVEIHGSFVSKSSPDHPEYDPLRREVIELLSGSAPGKKLMKADVFQRGRAALGREITNNEYLKVMHDLCVTSSTGWVLQKAQ